MKKLKQFIFRILFSEKEKLEMIASNGLKKLLSTAEHSKLLMLIQNEMNAIREKELADKKSINDIERWHNNLPDAYKELKTLFEKLYQMPI